MKVLFFIDSLVSGGKERRLTELLRTLKTQKNIDFELVVMNEKIHYKEVLELGINIHRIIRKTKKDISVFFKFYKLCREYKPDIIHCWDSMTAVYLVPICKLLKIKLVNGMVVNSPAMQNFKNKDWLRGRLTFPFSNVIVGNSKAGLLAYRAPKEKSIVINNGFNFDRTEKLIQKDIIKKELGADSEFIIGMVASFSPSKDYKTFFTAACQLLDKRADIIFLAIGARTDSKESKALIDEKYFKNFRLLGERSGVESYVNVMDVCVLSTFTEGISNSILEYMALDKPVVATEGGGTNEIVIDNKTGFLIPPSSPDELAGKLELLLDDADLRNKMGLEGKQRIMDEFSIRQMVNKYIDLYNKLNN